MFGMVTIGSAKLRAAAIDGCAKKEDFHNRTSSNP
jgi:hypothetical protein